MGDFLILQNIGFLMGNKQQKQPSDTGVCQKKEKVVYQKGIEGLNKTHLMKQCTEEQRKRREALQHYPWQQNEPEWHKSAKFDSHLWTDNLQFCEGTYQG